MITVYINRDKVDVEKLDTEEIDFIFVDGDEMAKMAEGGDIHQTFIHVEYYGE